MSARAAAPDAGTAGPTPLVSTKEPFLEPDRPRRIQEITFDVQSPIEIAACSALNVYEHRLMQMPVRAPTPHGPLDAHMGVSSRQAVCETCAGKLSECAGHFGHIQLHLPVFNIGYFKHVIAILQCICKSCARVLIADEEQRKTLRKLRRPGIERLQRAVLFKRLLDKAKRVKVCPWCGEGNGTVKKCPGSLKILHDRYGKGESEALLDRRQRFEDAAQANPEIAPLIKGMVELLDPLKVLELFRRVPDSDLQILDLGGRPENLLMTNLSVPPVCIRPSVEMEGGGGSNEDDITVKMMQIVEVNRCIETGLSGLLAKNVAEWWDGLQTECAQYINSDLPGMPSTLQTQGKRLRGFVQRLKGKSGRFRGNLSGKRVDFTGRTVISPDPNVRIDEVVVPELMATVLTYPERVTEHNIEKLRRAVINGTQQHPGARFVISKDGHKSFLQYGDRRRVAAELRVGDVVERHLCNGDVVLFNRQPSLHRVSIMAFRVRVLPGRTLRFNECCCTPFNADFDGDEMNIHVPQTEEARAEAMSLMGVLSNLMVPKSGEILVAATQDFLTCAFLLTRKDCLFSRAEFGQMCSYMGDGLERVDIPPPAIVKPLEMWTGKQLFSVLLRPNVDVRIFVTMETKEKMGCSCKGVAGPHACPNDGYVYVRNSELLMGRLGKSTLGGGSKTGLFSVMANDYSPRAAAACMSRLAKLSARFMGDRGFSIGIDDVTPSAQLSRTKNDTVLENYGKCDELILQYNKGRLPLNPGCTMEQTLENEIMSILNNVRNVAAGVCMKTLTPWNSPLIQSQCGSKGSPINICQMVACVGQQSISGKRSPNGFTDRTLPHFPRGDKTPEGKGFVANSFYTGLTPTEFFFHTMAGREGLVDTAVKTAETGYMSRRLMKSLEDLYVHYDGSVRSASKAVVQFKYGDDGLDPVLMEGGDGQPLDLNRLLLRVMALTPRQADETWLLPGALERAAERGAEGVGLVADNAWGISTRFVEAVRGRLGEVARELRGVRKQMGLPEDARGDADVEAVAGRVAGMTERQVTTFLHLARRKFESKVADPGATVGAYGAQSIGEPGTQMTLKTFHFAGVAAMNVTLGVPRIKEIINAARNISTHIMRVELTNPRDAEAAREVKARLEATTLGSVCEYIKTVVTPFDCYIVVKLDTARLARINVALHASQVARAVLGAKLKLKPPMIRVENAAKLLIFPDDLTKDKDREYEGKSLLGHMEELRKGLPGVVVSGVATVTRAIISQEQGLFKVFAEGTDLQAVMSTPGVQHNKTTTNHVMEVLGTLGIEAARETIIKEIQYTMGSHGMVIDYRHMMLLADCMTSRGEVLGITRFGIAKMKDSVLMLASFEKTTDHLFEAAVRRTTDTINGVSESIIMGIPIPVGTGLFRVLHNDPIVREEERVRGVGPDAVKGGGREGAVAEEPAAGRGVGGGGVGGSGAGGSGVNTTGAVKEEPEGARGVVPAPVRPAKAGPKSARDGARRGFEVGWPVRRTPLLAY